MLRSDKERIVDELAERLRQTSTLIVADYRGLTMKEVDELRTQLLEHGARFTVVKNSLTRRAAEEAGAEHVLALLEGPTAIAFLETDGDPAAVAKALADTARATKLLAVRGGVLEGSAVTAEQIEELAKLPPADVLRGQVLGAVAAPLYAIVGLFTAPLQDLHGLLQARIDQLGGEEGATDEASAAATEPAADRESAAATEPAAEETKPVAEAEPAETGEETAEPALEPPTDEEKSSAATEPAEDDKSAAAPEPTAEEPSEEPVGEAEPVSDQEESAAATEPADEDEPTAQAEPANEEEASEAATEPASDDKEEA